MKKITLLAATALTIAGLGSQTMVAQAAPQVYFAYGPECNTQNIWDQLENCFPSIILPEINCPEIDIPGLDCPGTIFPGVDCPETDCPNTDCPGTDCPGADCPETDCPSTDCPETDCPGADCPGTDIPENNTPETDVPGSTPDNDNPDNNGTEDNTPDETPDEDSSDNIHAYVKEVIDLVNAERAKAGLSALTMDLQVQAAAQVRAMECEQRFSHTRPNGTSFATALKEQNVSYRRAGENIAWGQRNPQTVVNAWMNSEGHRANIMNPNFTTIGVGYYQNANGTNYWCQLFTN